MGNQERILTLLEGIQGQTLSLEQNTNAKFEAMDKRLESMEQNTNAKFEAMDKRFESIEDTIVGEIESTRAELKAEIQYFHDELKDLRTDLANIE